MQVKVKTAKLEELFRCWYPFEPPTPGSTWWGYCYTSESFEPNLTEVTKRLNCIAIISWNFGAIGIFPCSKKVAYVWIEARKVGFELHYAFFTMFNFIFAHEVGSSCSMYNATFCIHLV